MNDRNKKEKEETNASVIASAPSDHKKKDTHNKTIKSSSSLHVPTYPFDFPAAIAMTDKLMEDLPPVALFHMADSDLQHLIIETK